MSGERLIVVPAQLANGAVVLVEVRQAEQEEQVWGGAFQFSEVVESVKGVVEQVVGPLLTLDCDEVTVEFGVEAALHEGRLVSLIVGGSVSSGLKVTTRWTRGPDGAVGP